MIHVVKAFYKIIIWGCPLKDNEDSSIDTGTKIIIPTKIK